MIKKLYIIGNGFDLHHCLKTSYQDFSTYLKENYERLYDTLEKYVSYPSSEKGLWSKFEENLSNLDVKEMLSANSNYLPDYASDEFREGDRYAFPDTMEQLHKTLTEELFSAFTNFIRQVEYSSISNSRKIVIDKSATFLTFNYTETLEKLYNIDKNDIVYIHNSAFVGNESIVLGHGIDPEMFEEKHPEPPDDLDPDQLEDWYDANIGYDYSFDEGKKNIMRYFKDTFKATKNIIDKYATFFKNLANVEEIIVLGHSISPVDLPYFNQIVQSVTKDVKWLVSYYDNEEGNKHMSTLTSLNIDKKNVTLIQLTDLLENNRQLKLDF